MRIARANGILIHYDAAGLGQGTPLVFANSLGTDFRLWDGLFAELPDGIATVRYDKRGHGLSALPDGSCRIEDHAADLAALLDSLSITGAVVCGVSVGGMIALQLAASRPGLVRGLVLSNTAHIIGDAGMWNRRIGALAEGGIEALADAVMERWFSQDYRNTNREEVAGWRAMLTRTPQKGYADTCAAIRDADLTNAARAIAVPALCIAGSEDGSTPPDAVRSLADLIPGSRFELIDGVGHLPCVEAPRTFATRIMGFLEERNLV